MNNRRSIAYLSVVVGLALLIGLPVTVAQLRDLGSEPSGIHESYGIEPPGNDDEDSDDEGDDGGNHSEPFVMLEGQMRCDMEDDDPGIMARYTMIHAGLGIEIWGDLGFGSPEVYEGDKFEGTETCAQHFQQFIQGVGCTTGPLSFHIWSGPSGLVNHEFGFICVGERNAVVNALEQLAVESLTADIF